MISLVMATYNGEQFIEEQLESIRQQTLLPDEVLICDDCSTDHTVDVVKRFIDKYELVNWKIERNTANKGYALNFSDAINAAKGDIIFLADQDDIWLSDKIRAMTDLMKNNPQIEVLASNVKAFYTGADPQKVNFEVFKSRDELIHITGYRRWIKPIRPGCSMCIRKSILEQYYQVWNMHYPHDCILWGIAVLNETAYLYNRDTLLFRRHDNNASSRSGKSVNYRIKELDREIDIISSVISCPNTRNWNNSIFLNKQLTIYKKRKLTLEKRNIVSAILMIRYVNYYGRIRYWLTDIYYCLRKRK